MSEYKNDLIKRYWTYQRNFVPQIEDYFERPFTPDSRPPVFNQHQAKNNVIVNPDATQEEISWLFSLLSIEERHKWFRSMNSSQALAQSILGNLLVYNQLSQLSELTDDEENPLFANAQVSSNNFFFEHRIDYLGEPRRTSLDVFISGQYQVAIECKFTEAEIGTCSRPRLKQSDYNYETDFCDGTYTRQRERKERCSLTEIGVLYWKYVPELFDWTNDIDLITCPLFKNYQLVRNILAVCVRPNGDVSPENGHMLLLYDDRNPAFQKGGNGWTSVEKTRDALKDSSLLRKCSWQRIVNHLRNNATLPWLTSQLELKYGL